jgi:hypothetical protein
MLTDGAWLKKCGRSPLRICNPTRYLLETQINLMHNDVELPYYFPAYTLISVDLIGALQLIVFRLAAYARMAFRLRSAGLSRDRNLWPYCNICYGPQLSPMHVIVGYVSMIPLLLYMKLSNYLSNSAALLGGGT